MSDVLEELADEEDGKLDRDHVERRLEDWRTRVTGLYSTVSNWLPAQFSTATDQDVLMNEELMARHQVAELRLPVLTILDGRGWFGKLVPRGLWIIGANGRLDLFTSAGHFIIADRAGNFEPPKWMIAKSEERQKQKILDRQSFLKAIGQ